MCYLVAAQSFVGKSLNKLALFSLNASMKTRGSQSTGYISDELISSGEFFKKDLGPCDKFFISNGLEATKLFASHGRYATTTNKEKEDAHPFRHEGDYGDILLMHNGIFTSHSIEGLDKKVSEYRVDSEVASDALSKFPEEDVLPNIVGYRVLVWVDLKNPDILKVYASSNSIYVGTRENEGVYFSSNKEPLASINCTCIYLLPEDIVYSFKDGLIINEKPVGRPKSYSGANWFDYNTDGTLKTKTTYPSYSKTSYLGDSKTEVWSYVKKETKEDHSSISKSPYFIRNEDFLSISLKKLEKIGVTDDDVSSLLDLDTVSEQLYYLLNCKTIDISDAIYEVQDGGGSLSEFNI